MDNQRIRVYAKRRPEIDADLVAIALLKIIEGLDPATKARLAEEGAAIAKRLDEEAGGTGKKETAA